VFSNARTKEPRAYEQDGAVFRSAWAIRQLWLAWSVPVVGAATQGAIYPAVAGHPEPEPPATVRLLISLRSLKSKEETKLKFRMTAVCIAVTTLALGVSSAKDSPDQKREKARKMASSTLAELYKLQPAARGAIQKSAGYAVFDNMGTNLLLLSTARGGGIAVNSATKQETFMKMISAGAGVGVGVKDYRVVFVFETPQGLSQFLDSGWDASAQADAAAKTKDSGGAYSGAANVSPGVWVYQITKKGLALQVTLQGTKYSKDDDLNKK